MAARSNRFSSLAWRKSTLSNPTECVEVACLGRAVLVRDSHDVDTHPIVMTAEQWRLLVMRIRSGDLDLA